MNWEITRLLLILAKRRPRLLLEIGTSKGGTLFLFSRVSNPDAVILSLDLPGESFRRGYPNGRMPFYESFATQKQKIHLLRGDSHASATLCMVEKILGKHKLDFLFIDGDHTYNGVKRDFEMYGKLVRKDGMIAFHDLYNAPFVNKFWHEIKDRYEHIEIVKDRKREQMGIGVLYL